MNRLLPTFFLASLFLSGVVNSVAQLAPHIEDKDCLSPMVSPRSNHQTTIHSSRSNTVVLFEDFENTSIPELPGGWDPGEMVEQQQNNNNGIGLGTFVSAWRTGDTQLANNGGYLPVPEIPGNHFAYSNDDGAPCNCDMEDVGLITPMMDFSGLQNMMISFDVYSQAVFGGSNLRLEISTNGADYETIFTASSNPEWQTVVLNLAVYDNEPSVWLRFAWSDNGFWSAGVAIDNVLVAENYEYNVGILRAHTAEVTAAWNDSDVVSGEYSQTPLSQASPMTLGARIMNKGALPMENIVLSVNIFLDGNLVGSYNSQVIPILYPMQQQNVFVNTDMVANAPATYTIEYELLAAGDEDMTDNFAMRTKSYSPDVYAMDEDAADSFRDNNSQSFTIGNLFEIPNEGAVCYSIGVGIGAPTIPFTQIQVRIYNSNFVFVAGSPNYQIQAADRIGLGENDVINIPLSSPVTLNAGQDYIAAVSYFHNPAWQFAVANSGSSQEQFSVFQDQWGDWFFVTTTPMIRMNLSSTVSVQEIAQIASLSIYPNPVKENYILKLNNAQPGPAQIMVTDIYGKIVAEKQVIVAVNGEVQNPVSIQHLSSGIYVLSIIQNRVVHSVRFVKTP